MFYWNYYYPLYPQFPQHREDASHFELNQRNQIDMNQVIQLFETHLAVSYEILSMVRLNHQMLKTLTSPSEELFFQHPAVYSSQT
ncbi:hypothetical protein DNHGIG_35800 [Collibacillus ludicampi]|uniref:Uncharacterized protein n=1 Tax=Collibacillus ludicampi TaxID=2771369 RepID=A0AAV4LJX4_9BACL|nr:hypothetical protein [Collibacillus ludicampi]GIM48031.1 hypothetical protein DNHGIG_35800 [Collibacillus ludicampi]